MKRQTRPSAASRTPRSLSETQIEALEPRILFSGAPVEAFAASYTVQGPRIIAASVQEGGTVPSGAATFLFTFDRPMQYWALSPYDFEFEGLHEGSVLPSSVQYTSVTDTSSGSKGFA